MDVIEMNSLLECGMCLGIFNDPRNLPCGHTFCFKCIKKLVDADKDKQPSCALCRTSWSVPDEGLQGVMKNFVLNNFVNSFGQQSGTILKCALIDDGDDHGNAEYFCIDCWDPLCADCNRIHKKSRLTKNHNTKNITDVTKVDIQLHKRKEDVKCTRHADKILEFFCNECNCAVCYACCVTSHFQHKCEGLGNVDVKFMEQIKLKIEEKVKIVKSYGTQLTKLEHLIKDLEEDYKQKLEELKLNTSIVRREIQKCFALIMEQIDEYEHGAEDNLLKMKKEETV